MQVYIATLAELVSDVAQRNGAKPALIFADTPTSYADLKHSNRTCRKWISGPRGCQGGQSSSARAEYPRVCRRLLRHLALRRNRRADQCAL
jgi:hypothetical protein